MGNRADGDGALALAAQLRSSEVRQAIVTFVGCHHLFEGRDITEYLRKFEIALHLHGLTDLETRRSFLLAVHPDVEEAAAEALEAADKAGSPGQTAPWAAVRTALRKTFWRQDSTRMTAQRFLDWITSSKDDDPDEVLRQFDRWYEELDRTDQVHFVDKTQWFLHALSTDVRKDAVTALEDGDDLTNDWNKVKAVARNLSRVSRLLRTDQHLKIGGTHDPPPASISAIPAVTPGSSRPVGDCDPLAAHAEPG